MKTLKDNAWMLRIIFTCAPGMAWTGMAVALLVAADNVLGSVLVVKYIMDTLAGGGSMQSILLALAFLAVLLLVRYGLHSFCEHWFKPKAAVRIRQKLTGDLCAKAMGLDLARYDDPKFYDECLFSAGEADSRAMQVYETTQRTFSCVVMVAGYLVFMGVMDLFAFVPTALYVALSFWLDMRRTKLRHALDEETKLCQRKIEYVGRACATPEFARDVRLSRVKEILFPMLYRAENENAKIRMTYGRRFLKLDVLAEIGLEQLILNGGVYVYLLVRALSGGDLTAGGLLVLASAIENTTWRMNDLMRLIPEFAGHALHIRHLREMLETQSNLAGGALQPEMGDVTFERVTFGYDEDDPILRDFSFTFKMGEKVAVVGENGAGKSTLVKLILRLYDPQKGRILLNGQDIRTLNLEAYRACFATALQESNLYAASLSENVAMDTEMDLDRVQTALKKAFFGSDLPLETRLTREYDPEGTMLSGGEAQCVYTARALYRDAPFMILDEPSAALDPLAERDFNRAFAENAEGKSVLLISHRLSTVTLADRICVIENGRAVETGAHGELLRMNGAYRRMWDAQASAYITDSAPQILPA